MLSPKKVRKSSIKSGVGATAGQTAKAEPRREAYVNRNFLTTPPCRTGRAYFLVLLLQEGGNTRGACVCCLSGLPFSTSPPLSTSQFSPLFQHQPATLRKTGSGWMERKAGCCGVGRFCWLSSRKMQQRWVRNSTND